MRTACIAAFVAISATSAYASGKPFDNLNMMMVIKAVCQLDPPAGVYERELGRYMSEPGMFVERAVMEISQEALRLRSRIGDGNEDFFCGDVKKTYSDSFYGK
ncbi:hypothetical protein [Sinorhizobium medicae]|uniref:hypothetical protein n=1 Tax=Sinorhizobium medicae TaxID=110321 RepID=UPI0012953C96|nr:hypothetical protein [Sinorhizobium medicae]MQX45736.1 hypothetical protein [Sinorhizobium medicae]